MRRFAWATALVLLAVLSCSWSVRAQARPDPPTALSAQVLLGTLTLSWTAATGGPSTYVVEAGSAPGEADLANAATGSLATTFVVSGVPSRTYFVRVLARNSAGTSTPSNEVTVVVNGHCPLPPSPSGLTAAVTGAAVTLTWTGTATSYQLEAGSGPGLAEIFSGDVGPTTTVTAAVVPGTFYVRTRARNVCGLSPPSNEAIVPVGVPAPPTGLVASIINSALTFQWAAPAGGGMIGYVLEAGSAPGLRNLATLALGSTATSLTVPGVPDGTYHVRVRAANAAAAGPPSNELTVTVGPPAPGHAVVTFNTLPPNGPAFTTHTEAGFTVAAVSGPWTSGPALISKNPSPTTALDSELEVTASGGGTFRFTSARLYSSITPIRYVFRGELNGVTVYTATATVPNTFGSYATVPNPFGDVGVDAVFITVTNPAIPTCPTCIGNPVGIDDIVVRP